MIWRAAGHHLDLRGRAIRAGLLDGDLHVLECRDQRGKRRFQRQFPLLHQHHRGDRGDRLGHRIDAEERVLRHRGPRCRVLHAETLEIGNLAVAGDDHAPRREFSWPQPRPSARRPAGRDARRKARLRPGATVLVSKAWAGACANACRTNSRASVNAGRRSGWRHNSSQDIGCGISLGFDLSVRIFKCLLNFR